MNSEIRAIISMSIKRMGLAHASVKTHLQHTGYGSTWQDVRFSSYGGMVGSGVRPADWLRVVVYTGRMSRDCPSGGQRSEANACEVVCG